MGYNLLFGYAGLLSLGHAMFFAAGLYGAGLTVLPSRLGRAGSFRRGAGGRRAACAGHRPSGAAHHRRRLHDRHHDVRAGLLPADPLFRRMDARRRRPGPPAAGARDHARRRRARPHRPDDALHGGAGALLHRARRHARHRPLGASAACSSPSARTRSARGCWATTPSPTSSRRWSRRAPSAPPPARPMCSCSAMSARRSPRCSIPSCRCSGCCSAARPPRSGRCSARCSCTMSSTSPAATPPPTC